MQPFDPIHSSLHGTCLIEAGAGTGKTYTIATLVLRLLLQKALAPEQILVVTFTTAATAELRDRLRRRLREAKGVLQGQVFDDVGLNELLENCGPRDVALDRLEDALANFDCLPVFTIHGFCQRILHEMAFETGSGFDAELVTDAASIIQGLADDFWRKTWYDMPPEPMALALKIVKSPEDLADLYRRYAIPDIMILPQKNARKAPTGANFRACWTEARRQWQQCRDDVLRLLASPSLKANIYGSLERPPRRAEFRHKRDEKIQAWAHQLDHWFAPTGSRFPLPDAVTYFSQAKLDASFKKGTQGPRHAFFDVCDRLLEEAHVLAQAVRQWVIAWQARFFRYANQELDRYKKENQVLFYDDLLLKVRDALQRDRSGRLRHLLRARYKAALIDEFQDTDMVQYTIFAHLFDSPDSMMFMIGDPKQAIYSFRGADIFTYLRAARNAGQRFTLTQNWRSTPGMVQAVNTLFGQHPHPFLWPAIQFYPATAAVADRAPPGGDDPSTPLTIWFLDNPAVAKGRRALNKKTASACICHAVAREVRRCVAASGPKSDGITYQDVAILVRTNRQAGEVKNAFAAARIPAVVYNAGSVFHRPEALDLRRVLAAVADPGSEVKLRTALTTRFFGRTGQELNFNDHVPIWWEETIDRFFRYRAMWSEGGFIRMFRRLLIEEKAAPRLLAGASGERYLTNILHLSELLHQTAVEQGKGVGELIQWLDQRRQQTSDTADAHQTRLESDDDAVTILTIHKSKGLEFPVVFCPFSWEGLGAPAVPALFHDRERDDRRVLDLGSDEIEHHLAVNAEEGMAEALRLLYVAVTRAKRQCYLVWGPLPSAAYSAPVYLMYGERDNGRNGDFWAHMQASARDFQRRDSRTLRRDMTALARRSDGAIAVVDMPDETTQMPEQPDQPMVSLVSRRLQRKLTSGWRIASFSSLIHGRHEESEIIDDAAPPETVVSGGLPGAETANAEGTIGDIAGFEASARAGLFFHDLLERIDFTAPARANWRPQIEDLLQAYGFDPRWRSAVLDMLRRVIRTPLEAGPGASFALDQISHDNRLNELEFHLPLAAVDAASLGHAFAACRQPAFQGRLPTLMEELNFQLSGGYLKGFIDLVLRHDDRYYIVDWKSNFLGDTFEAYRPARLAQVMEGEYYFLQYHIYLLAWDQYMRTCYPDYQYERDFGGVYYLFIRGMEPSSPSSGLFFDRPGPELLQGLRRTLLVSNH